MFVRTPIPRTYKFLCDLVVEEEPTFVSLNVHGVNAVYVLVDLFITGIPVRLYHVIYPMLFSLIYLIFSLVYVYSGGTNPDGDNFIYDALNFKTDLPSALLVLLLLVCLMLLIQGILFLLFLTKTFMYGNCEHGGTAEEKAKIILDDSP